MPRTLSLFVTGLLVLAARSLAAASGGPGSSSDAIPAGVVVESAQRGFVAERGGIRAGDVLLSWSTEAGDRSGDIVSPLLMTDLEYGELPRGPIVLIGTRNGAPLEVTVSADAVGLGLDLRPRFPPALLALYRRGHKAVDAGRVSEGVALWREAAARARTAEGGRSAQCWLLGKLGDAWAVARESARAYEAYDDATTCAEEGDPRELATILQWQADQAFELREPEVTLAALEMVFTLLDSHADAPPLSVMQSLFDLAAVLPRREIARLGLHAYMLDLAERHAPESVLEARVLLLVGQDQILEGQLEAAEGTLTRAAEIAERAGPLSTTWARAQTALGGLAGTRGDLVTLEDQYQKAAEQLLRLQPGSLDAGRALVNLSAASLVRGDPEATLRWSQAAVRSIERLSTGRQIRAAALNNQGRAALLQGDLGQATSAFERALEDFSAVYPSSRSIAIIESNLSEALLARRDVAGARHHADRAVEQAERFAPHTLTMVEALEVRGDVARREDDWDVAADCYAWALETVEELGARTLHLGRAHQGMASVARHRGDTRAAERHLRQAVALYESKRGVGRSDEERSLFASAFHGAYRELIELLVEQGRVKEGFELLEASRARSLRSMVASRDLQFQLDVPPERERERRAIDAAHERAREELTRLPASDPQAAALKKKVDALHERLLRVEAEINRASPRLATLREPEAMGPAAVSASLVADALLVAYSTGAERTVVFALGHEGDDTLQAHVLPVGEDGLRERIARWRRLAQSGPAGSVQFQAEGRALHALLLGPLGERLGRAKRLIVSVDGPLHALPFAALRDERGFLVESKALTFVPSGAYYAQQRAEVAASAWTAPAAFGDPRSPKAFAPLPGSRREIAYVASVFPDMRTYLGGEASEDNVRALARTVRFAHFAVHGVADSRAPLDSALVLSGQAAAGDGDNGFLHAWEIFERVRLDADLVTLSACDSAAGAYRPGEGISGLTRAFLYAGARSVLASLWAVGDGSTAPFMRTFYDRWAMGESKADALRHAQLDAIRRGQRPLRWAAFQLYGDDRPEGACNECGAAVTRK